MVVLILDKTISNHANNNTKESAMKYLDHYNGEISQEDFEDALPFYIQSVDEANRNRGRKAEVKPVMTAEKLDNLNFDEVKQSVVVEVLKGAEKQGFDVRDCIFD